VRETIVANDISGGGWRVKRRVGGTGLLGEKTFTRPRKDATNETGKGANPKGEKKYCVPHQIIPHHKMSSLGAKKKKHGRRVKERSIYRES